MNSCPQCDKGNGLSILLTRYTVVNNTDYCHIQDDDENKYKKDKDEYLQEINKEQFKRLKTKIDQWNNRYSFDINAEQELENLSIAGRFPKMLDVKHKYNGVTATKNHKFAQKLLRSGFLYVYNEFSKDSGFWEAYVITDKSYLIPFNFYRDDNLDMNNVESCCSDKNKIANSLVIKIKKPEETTNVWFKYSNTKWTNNIKKQFSSEKYRQKYMQCLNVQKLQKGENAQKFYALTDYNLRKSVIDFFSINTKSTTSNSLVNSLIKSSKDYFKEDEISKSDDLYFVEKTDTFFADKIYKHNISSPLLSLSNSTTDRIVDIRLGQYQFKRDLTLLNSVVDSFSIDNQVRHLSDNQLHDLQEPYLGCGVIVPIDDMIGLAIDANVYLAADEELKKTQIPKNEKVCLIIESLKTQIKFNSHQNLVDAIYKQTYDRVDPIRKGEYSLTRAKITQEKYEEQQKLVAKKFKISYEDLLKAEEDEWQIYEKRINLDKYQSALQAVKSREQFHREHISSIARFYLDILQCCKFNETFLNDFDDQNILHGIEYVRNLLCCIYGAQLNHFCKKQFEIELLNINSPFHKALTLNQKNIQDEINKNNKQIQKALIKTTDTNTDYYEYIKGISEVVSNIVSYGEKKNSQLYTLLNNLITHITAPLTSVILKKANGFQKLLVYLGVMSQQTFYYTKVEDTYRNFYKQLSQTVINIKQTNIKNISKLTKTLRNVKLPEVVDIISKEMPNKKVSTEVLLFTCDLKKVKSSEELAKHIALGNNKAKTTSLGSLTGFISSVQFIVSCMAFHKAIKDVFFPEKNKDPTLLAYLGHIANLVLISTQLFFTAYQGIKSFQAIWVKNIALGSPKIFAASISTISVKTALGIAGALLDIYMGISDINAGNYIDGAVKIITGIITLIAVIIADIFPIIAAIAALIAFLIAIIYPQIKDNEFQEWINKSCLGKNSNVDSYQEHGLNDIDEFTKIVSATE